MFDIGFSEVIMIFGLALVVLGPEKLPKLAATIGRWVGRARAMARQFQDQLETEAESIKSGVSDVQSDLQSSFSELKAGVSDVEHQIRDIGKTTAPAATADDTTHHERGTGTTP
jgi:sec-independent protein translocase protein TatB